MRSNGVTGEQADYVVRANTRIGTTIGGKYRIDRVLGIGGMAAVFAATHRNGHRVALKLLNPELSARADMRARFRREGQAANTVNHPGVVVVTDDDVAEDGSAYLVMELLDGEVVEGIWGRSGQRLPVSFVLALGRELCAVLSAAHRAGVVHRDLKPENLFVTREGRLKVLDFGLAQLRDAARPKDTHTGMVFGTPAFMPPEQASGRTSQLDARTDLWAVGATMFTLLSGVMVHEGETAQHFVMLAATAPARPLATALPNVHPEVASVIDRALSFDKSHRWESADAMREAIRAASRLVLGDADVPLALQSASFTGRGQILAPVDDTLTEDDDDTRIERSPLEPVESSAPPTEPKGRAPAAALAMTSDTPTKERHIGLPEDPLTEPRRLPIPVPLDTQHTTTDSEVPDIATRIQMVAVPRRPAEPPAANRTSPAFDTTQPIESSEMALQQQTAVLQSPHSAGARPTALQRSLAVSQNRESYLLPVAANGMRPVRRDPRLAHTPLMTGKSRFATLLPVIPFALLALIALPIGLFVLRDRGGPQTQAISATSFQALPATSGVVSAIAPAAPTEKTVNSAAFAAPTPQPIASPSFSPPRITTPAAHPTASSKCSPPFDLDDAGMKHWKVDCL